MRIHNMANTATLPFFPERQTQKKYQPVQYKIQHQTKKEKKTPRHTQQLPTVDFGYTTTSTQKHQWLWSQQQQQQ
jgi:hypothetical protein